MKLRFRRTWGLTPKFNSSYVLNHGQVTPDPWLKGSVSFTKKNKPQETCRQHHRLWFKGKIMKCVRISVGALPSQGGSWNPFRASCTLRTGRLINDLPPFSFRCSGSQQFHGLGSYLTSIWGCLTLIPQDIFFSSIGTDGWARIGMLLNQALHTFPRLEWHITG